MTSQSNDKIGALPRLSLQGTLMNYKSAGVHIFKEFRVLRDFLWSSTLTAQEYQQYSTEVDTKIKIKDYCTRTYAHTHTHTHTHTHKRSE